MTQTVGIGLVGYGGIGRMHALCWRMLPLIYPEVAGSVRLVGVASGSEKSTARARQELGDVVVTTDLDELLAVPGLTVIDCCTPTDDHPRVARAALAAGKALFCEKPLAATASSARELASLARERGSITGVNFHFRQIPAIQEAHRRIADGLLGTVISFHMSYYRASNLRRDRPITWRSTGPGSGVLLDLGSHLVDLVLHLLGPVTQVAATTRTLIAERPGPDGTVMPVDADDIAWLQLELADGGRGTIEASKVVPGAADDVRIEVYGTDGTLIFDTRDPNRLYLADGTGAPVGGESLMTFSRTMPPAVLPGAETPTGVIQWHLASLGAFLAAFAQGRSAQPDLDAATRVQDVLDAALASAASGGVRVTVLDG